MIENMEHRIISTLELNNGEDDDFLEEDWYKELCKKIDEGNSSYYDDYEVDPLWDNYMVKYSPDRKRLGGNSEFMGR